MKNVIKKLKYILLPFLGALVINSCSYLMDNLPYSYFDDLNLFSWIAHFSIFEDSQDEDNDVYFLDVAYDKSVIKREVEETYKGTIDITNRDTLLSFLRLVDKMDNYRLIFIDLYFDEENYSKTDSALFAQIDKMNDYGQKDKVLVVKHSCFFNDDHPNKLVERYSSFNEYFPTFLNTNFSKFTFFQEDEVTAPTRIYNALYLDKKVEVSKWLTLWRFTMDGEEYKPAWKIPVSFVHGHLFRNSPTAKIPRARNFRAHDYLGPSFMLDSLSVDGGETVEWGRETREDDINGKILIIGDFSDDLHSSYSGRQYGSYLTYLSYKALTEERHLVSWWLVAFLMLFYTSILCLFKKGFSLSSTIQGLLKAITSYINRQKAAINQNTIRLSKDEMVIRKIWGILLSPLSLLFNFFGSSLLTWMSYSILLSFFIAIPLYYSCDIVYNVFFPATILSLIETYNNIKAI